MSPPARHPSEEAICALCEQPIRYEAGQWVTPTGMWRCPVQDRVAHQPLIVKHELAP